MTRIDEDQDGLHSVDFVPRAGAGGKYLSMFESARGRGYGSDDAARDSLRESCGDRERGITLAALAYHEAGHAVVRALLGGAVGPIVLDLENGSYATSAGSKAFDCRAHLGIGGEVRDGLMQAVMVDLAGEAAQTRYLDTLRRTKGVKAKQDYRGSGDRRAAAAWAELLTSTHAEKDALLNWLRVRVRDLIDVEYVWRGIEAVAAALAERRELSGDDVLQILSAIPRAAVANAQACRYCPLEGCTGRAAEYAEPFYPQARAEEDRLKSEGRTGLNDGPQSRLTQPVGRNAPCPCGKLRSDGQPVKYKLCCGK